MNMIIGKYIKDVFRYIDTDRAGEYTDFMLNILGADSLEEALSWAQSDGAPKSGQS